MFNITAGNDISFRISLYRGGDAFPVELSHDVVVNVVSSKTRRSVPFSIDEGVVYVDVLSEGLGTGIYGIEIRGVLNGGTWRSYYDSVWQYTLATRAGDGYSDSEGDVYDITMDVQFYTSGDIDAKIEAHNQSEEAHPYIRGLIAQKQDVIPDLATIRSGAEKGATAYQKPAEGIPVNDLDDYAQEGISKGTLVYATVTDEGGVVDRVTAIEGKIPSAASSTNKLADVNFVNSSISTNTAYYISNNGQPFTSLAQLQAYSGPITNNDYAFVVGTDAAGNTTYTRYKYNADTEQWAEEYVLNNSSFTAAQWAAISSGITSGDVAKLAALPTKTQLDALLAAKQDTLKFDNLPTQNSNNPVKSGGVFTALAGKADKVVVENVSFVSSQQSQMLCMLLPNKIYECTFVDYMHFGVDEITNTEKCEYCIKFDVASTIPTLSLPSDIIWAEELTLEQNKHYVLLINYENGAMYGDWKSYNIASV